MALTPAELRELGLALVRLADALDCPATPGETIDHLAARVERLIDDRA